MSVAMIGPKFYAWDRNGKPLAFGKLYTYQARTNTPKPTYQSEDQVVENTNPVILNGEGYANVYLDGSYKMVLKDSDDNEIWSSDPVTSNMADEWVNCFSAFYVSPTSFKLAGNQVDSYLTGRKLRVDNSETEYSYTTVVSSVFASGETSVVTSDAVIKTSINNVCTSVVSEQSSFNKRDLGDISAYSFDTVQNLEQADYLKSGDFVQIKERGESFWEIKESLTPNGFDVLLTGVSLLFASLVNSEKVNFIALGAKGDNSTDNSDVTAYASALGKTIFVPNGQYKVTSISPAIEAFTVFEGESDSQFIFENSHGFTCNSTYFSGFRNLRLQADDKGTAVLCSIGMKNFIFENMLIRNFEIGLDWSNAFLGNINKINIENCDIGFRAVNAYLVNYQGLVIHWCRICFQYSGRSSLISNMDLSYFDEAGLDLAFARLVEFSGLYMELPQQPGAVFVRFSGSGEKGVTLSALDLSSGNVANNLVYFDFDNGQVDTDIIIEHVRLKADGGTGHIGFKFGAVADAKITFQNEPLFEESGGVFADKYIYGSARIEFRDSVNTRKVASGKTIVADHAFLEGSTGPKYRRSDSSCNYESQFLDSIGSGVFIDLQSNATDIRGFITVVSEDGFGIFFVDNRTTPGSGALSIVYDPDSILSVSNPSPGANKWSLVFSSGIYKLRNTWNTNKTAELRKSTPIDVNL